MRTRVPHDLRPVSGKTRIVSTKHATPGFGKSTTTDDE